jgi:deferrochelatase/peroxidase EfeB
MSEIVLEPVLPLAEIQGVAVPGFFKPHQTLLGVLCPEKPAAVQAFKELLRKMVGEIATGEQTLEDRRRFRAHRIATSNGRSKQTLTGLGFTSQGLRKLTPGAAAIPSDAFQQGLAMRSAFLGDPTDPHDEGSPSQWKVGGPNNAVDALFVVAGDSRAAVDRRVKQVTDWAKKAKLLIIYAEEGDVREDLPGHEHFGFDDGVSQPGIRGRASESPRDFITERHINAKQQPEHSLFGYPGQDLVWPGAFLLGQPDTSPDPLIPGPPSSAIPGWTRNGSFLVFRRLRQDVGLFWRTMKREAARLAQLPGFENMTDELLASRIVGRWPSSPGK